jgi:hypothetical protein
MYKPRNIASTFFVCCIRRTENIRKTYESGLRPSFHWRNRSSLQLIVWTVTMYCIFDSMKRFDELIDCSCSGAVTRKVLSEGNARSISSSVSRIIGSAKGIPCSVRCSVSLISLTVLKAFSQALSTGPPLLSSELPSSSLPESLDSSLLMVSLDSSLSTASFDSSMDSLLLMASLDSSMLGS